MIKVLMVVKAMEKTGVTSVMASYYRLIDHRKFQIDVLCGSLYEEQYKKDVEKNGGQFIVVENRDKNIFKYVSSLKRIMELGEYDIVHVHGNSALIFPELLAAKQAGIQVRIAHSHNTRCNHPQIEKLVRPIFNRCYTHGLACSQEAGEWMFKKRPFTIIFNGTDMQIYAFSEQDRIATRSELDVNDDDILIGHIGYFDYQKNHPRLIDIFEKIHNYYSHTKLLLIGDGSESSVNEIKSIVEQKEVQNSAIFYGTSDNIPKMLSAMDVFILPSHFEGFPVVLMEAQASGLNCVTSCPIPKEAAVAVDFISLDEKDEIWAKTVINSAKKNLGMRKESSNKNRQQLTENGFDLTSIVRNLEMYYDTALTVRGG